jgi:CHASE3 domain
MLKLLGFESCRRPRKVHAKDTGSVFAKLLDRWLWLQRRLSGRPSSQKPTQQSTLSYQGTGRTMMLDTERETEMKLALKVLLSRKALLGALPVVVALLLSGVISFSYNLLLKNYRDAVDHTFQVMSGIDNVLLRLRDAETGQRGFIITGDDAYLAPFKSAEQELSEALAGLGRLVSDNADQQIEIANLQQLADGKLSELQQTIMTRRNEGWNPQGSRS